MLLILSTVEKLVSSKKVWLRKNSVSRTLVLAAVLLFYVQLGCAPRSFLDFFSSHAFFILEHASAEQIF